ncbi:MAG: hypothetical protein QOG66_1516 [Methylobacteriaceae bacterium]|jgi:hypothetical protein|nr:hypothetical protein [Methylobacteriaceae bacterium]
MTNQFANLSAAAKWRLMVEGAKLGAASQGYTLKRVPGRGLSNIWTMSKDGKTLRASIRTTRDRWFAFPPLAKGKKWKTLDEVDTVIVASVDSRDEPENVEVFIFPADEVRARFNAARTARVNAGQAVQDNFGMWVRLDYDNRKVPAAVGSGIIDKYKFIATYSLEELIAGNAEQLSVADDKELSTSDLTHEESSEQRRESAVPLRLTIPEAKAALAATLGVSPGIIKITIEG